MPYLAASALMTLQPSEPYSVAVVHDGDLRLALALQVAEQLVGREPGGLRAEEDIGPDRRDDRVRRALGNHRDLRRLDLIEDGGASGTEDRADDANDLVGDQFLDDGRAVGRVRLIVLDFEVDLRAIDAAPSLICLTSRSAACLLKPPSGLYGPVSEVIMPSLDRAASWRPRCCSPWWLRAQPCPTVGQRWPRYSRRGGLPPQRASAPSSPQRRERPRPMPRRGRRRLGGRRRRRAAAAAPGEDETAEQGQCERNEPSSHHLAPSNTTAGVTSSRCSCCFHRSRKRVARASKQPRNRIGRQYTGCGRECLSEEHAAHSMQQTSSIWQYTRLFSPAYYGRM